MDFFDILFLIAWAIVPFIWFLVLRLGGIPALTLSLPNIVIFFIIIFNYIGFPVLYFDLDSERAIFISNKSILLQTWLITSGTTFLMVIGSYMGALTLGPLGFFKRYDASPIYIPNYIIKRTNVVGIFCICILLLFVYKISFSNLAVIVALTDGSVQDIALARSRMGNDFGGSYHWYQVFMRDVLMFISLILLAARWLNIGRVSLILLYIFIILNIFSLIMATEKGWLANYIILLMLGYIIAKNEGKISFLRVLLFLFPLFIIIVMFYILFMGDLSFGKAVISVFSRTFTGSLQPAYHYVEFFPTSHDWLYGTTFPNPGGFLPFTPYNLTIELMNFVNPEHLDNNIVGTMPAIYWGEVYANFGYFGLVLIPALIGFLLYLLNWLIFKLEFNPLNISLFAWLLVHYRDLSITSFSVFVFDFTLYIIFLIYIIIRIPLFKSGKVLR